MNSEAHLEFAAVANYSASHCATGLIAGLCELPRSHDENDNLNRYRASGVWKANLVICVPRTLGERCSIYDQAIRSS